MIVQDTIKLANYDLLAFLLGPKDEYLNLIKKDTKIKIGVQGIDISLFGEEEEVERIGKVFLQMLEYDKLSRETIHLILEQSKEGKEFLQTDESVILKYGKKEIRARTEGQLEYLRSMRNNPVTICIGAAGSSKTYSSVCYALSLLKNKQIDKIILTRPMVNAKGENDLGALPGELNNKLSLYVLPLTDVFERVLGKDKLQNYIESGKIEMLPIGYMRGVSLYNSFLLVDEAENLNITLAKLLVTRLGKSSKMVICGDPMQQDFYGESGLEYLANSLRDIDGVGVVRMKDSDIVRHPLIAKMLSAFTAYDNSKKK